MEAPSVSPVEALLAPEDKPHEEPPNCVKTNCENTMEVPHLASDAPAVESVDGGGTTPTGGDVGDGTVVRDKEEAVCREKKVDVVNNDKSLVVHIEPTQKESIALDKPKRQRKKKEPKDYDAITSSSFCHMATSPSRAQNKSPSRGCRSPARSGQSPARTGTSPSRGGQSPAKSSQSPARGGQSPAKSSQSPGRGGHSPARGGQSPARNSQSPGRGGRSPVRCSQSPARSSRSPAKNSQSPAKNRQSPARSSQSPARGSRSPARNSRSPARGNRSPARNSQSPAPSSHSPIRSNQISDKDCQNIVRDEENHTDDNHSSAKDDATIICGEKTVFNGGENGSTASRSPAPDHQDLNVDSHSSQSGDGVNSATDKSPCKKYASSDHCGPDAVLSVQNSLDNCAESGADKVGDGTVSGRKTGLSNVTSSQMTAVNSKKSVKKKAPKKSAKNADNVVKKPNNDATKECPKKAKKRKSGSETTDKNTSATVPKNSSKPAKSPVINNKHSDTKDIVNQLSEPKKKKRKKAVKLNETVNDDDSSNLEKENAETEGVSKSKKKCVKKKQQLNKDIGVSNDIVDADDTLDTITAVLNHVIAESTKCYLEDNIEDGKPAKSKKKAVVRKKVPSPKGGKTIAENHEPVNSEPLPANSPVREQVADLQLTKVNADDGTKTEKEKKSKKKKVAKAVDENGEKQEQDSDCKPKRKKPSARSKVLLKCNNAESNVKNSVTPSEVIENDDDAQKEVLSVPPMDASQPDESVALPSSPKECTVDSEDVASSQTAENGEVQDTEQEEPSLANNLEQKDDGIDEKQGDNEHSNQEASEGSKKDDGAQSSGSGSENRVFQCPKCSYNSKKKVSLRRHMTVHGVYECAHCDFVSDHNSEYEDHMRDKHPSRCGRKLCKKCNVLFRVDEIEQHEKECTGEKKKWTCSECKKEFKFLCTMRAHVQKWHVSSGIKCDKCEFEANTNYTLKKHIMKVHKPVKEKKPISCAECNKTFSSDSCYRQHMKLHEGQEYECPKCGKVFKSTRSMQTHLKIHEETKSVPCEVAGCTKVFKNVKVMEIHRKRCHENEPKKFKCTYGTCEQRFYTKYHLKRHEIMHTGERNFKCTYPDCSKAFHHAENLKVHLRSHNNIKCPQCRRTFKEEASLQTHLKIHENAKSRSKKKRKPPPVENAKKPKSDNTESKPDAVSLSSPSETPAAKTSTEDDLGKESDVAPTAENRGEVSLPPLPVDGEAEQSKKVDSAQHDVYDFHDSDDEKLAVSAIARQTSPNKSPRIKVGGELLGTLPLPSAPDAMLVKSVAVSDDEPVVESTKKKKKTKKKKAVSEIHEESKASEVDSKPKEKKRVVKKKKPQEGGEKKLEDVPVKKDDEAKDEEKIKKVKKPKKKVEKKTKEKAAEEKQVEKPEKKDESDTKTKKKKPRKKKSEKDQETKQLKKDEVVEPKKKKKKKQQAKKVEKPVPMETTVELSKEPEPEPEAKLEAEPEPATEPPAELAPEPPAELAAEPPADLAAESPAELAAEPVCETCPDRNTDMDMCTEESEEPTILECAKEDETTKPEEDEQTHQSEPEIGPQPSPTPEYLDDQQHGFFSPRPEQVDFQYPMAPRPVSPEEDDDDIDMMDMEQSYSDERPEQNETKVLESPLSEMSSEMKSLTLPSVSRESPGANHDDNDHHSDLVAGLSPTIKDINGQEDEMLNDIAKQVEAESAIVDDDDAAEMPPSNYPSSIHTTPPSVQPPSVPPASVAPPPQEVPVITSHTSHILEESSAIGDMVSRYEGEAATRDLYQAPLSNSSSTQQQSSHHYSSIVDQQLSQHKYLQEAPLSVQSRGHLLPDDNPTPTSSSPPSIPPPKYYMDGSSYPPSVYHSHRVPSVPPPDLPPTSPAGPVETTPTYSDSLSHSSSHYRSDSQTCPSYPPRDSLPSVTTPSYSSPPQNTYLDPHSASLVNNKEDTTIPSVSSTDRTSDSMYLTSRSSNLPTSAAETLPANSSAPPSVSFGSDSLPTRELFGQYFGQDSTGSMPLTHPPLSQEQRGLPYPHSQSQTSLPTLPGANSADYFRRASAPFIPGTGYPSVTETLVPPPPQHWMSAHDERSRQWGQPSPIIPPPIPSELDSASPLSRNPYVSRPSEYSFNPTTTSHSSKQTESSYPGSQSISTPAERPTYDMTSAYMTSRTFNPNYTGPMPPPPPSAATQKQLEEAYRRAAQISDYRTLSQAAPPSMADMYSRMAVPPALGFDKYYYSRDAMFRSQHLSAAPNPFMTQSSTPQMPYTERDYGRNPIYTQHSAYGFMGDKQYLASNKLPPTLPGLQERPMPADYLQSPAAAAAMGDPHIQDPYRRSVIYNMMSRYF